MRNFFAITLGILLVAIFASQAMAVIPGDVNQNGKLTMVDVAIILKMSVDGSKYCPIADVSGDKKINAQDALMVQQKIARNKQQLVASIEATPVKGEVPLRICYNGDLSRCVDSKNEVVSHEWDFGDGSENCFKENGSYIYSKPGMYMLTLMVTDNDGVTVSDSVKIVVTKRDNPIKDNNMKAYVWYSATDVGWDRVAKRMVNGLEGSGFDVIFHVDPTPQEIYKTIEDNNIRIYHGLGHGTDKSASVNSGEYSAGRYYASFFGDSIRKREQPFTVGIFNHCGGYSCCDDDTWLSESTQDDDNVVAQRFYGEGWCEKCCSVSDRISAQGYSIQCAFKLMGEGLTYKDAIDTMTWSYAEGRKKGNEYLRYPQFCGDVNYDMNVDSNDVELLRNYLDDPNNYSIHSDWDADVNGDNLVNSDDYYLLCNHVDNPLEHPLNPRGWFINLPTQRLINPVGAIASSYYNDRYMPTNAIDGNMKTHWFTRMYDASPWIQFDIGSRKWINSVQATIFCRDVPMTLDVQVSNDAKSWDTIVSDFTIVDGSIPVKIQFDTQVYTRYVRLYETDYARVYGQCSDFSVYTYELISAHAIRGKEPFTMAFASVMNNRDGDNWCEWDFGDGETSTLNNPIHIYDEPGIYMITLTVYGDEIKSDITVIKVENKVPVVQIFMPPTTVKEGTPAYFYSIVDDNDGEVVRYEWDFGDGEQSALAKPNHIYTESDMYTVVLTVYDNNGASASDSKRIIITDR